MSKIKNVIDFVKRRYILSGAVVLVVALFFIFGGGSSSEEEIISVAKSTVEEQVSFTGTVESASKVSLAFEKGGRVLNLDVDVGDSVYRGQFLASLSDGDTLALLDQARASAQIEEATLSDMLAGTREEEVAVKRAKVSSAEAALLSARQAVRDSLGEAFVKSDDVVRNTLDPLFDNDTGTSQVFIPTLVFSPINSQLKANVESKRILVEEILRKWATSANKNYLVFTDNDISDVENNLSTVGSLLDDITSAFVGADKPTVVTQATFDTWRSNVSTARGTISTVVSKVTSAHEKYTSAVTALAVAKNELALAEAGSTSGAILAQQARVASAKAKVAQYESEFRKSAIYAPIDGVIASRDMELGEIVPLNKEVLSIISKAEYQIRANVSELDVGKLSAGMSADVTLDAYGPNEHFKATIITVDPAETVVDNVPKYKVKLSFNDKDERIKSGLTANVIVTSVVKEDVVAIESRAITSRDGKKFVKVLVDGKKEDREVVVGIRGKNGEVEIVSGLSPQEKVLIPQATTNK